MFLCLPYTSTCIYISISTHIHIYPHISPHIYSFHWGWDPVYRTNSFYDDMGCSCHKLLLTYDKIEVGGFLPTWDGSAVVPAPPVDSIRLQLSPVASVVGVGGSFGRWWCSACWLISLQCVRSKFVSVAVASARYLWGDHLQNRQESCLRTVGRLLTCGCGVRRAARSACGLFVRYIHLLAGRHVRPRFPHVSALLNVTSDVAISFFLP